MQGARRVVDYLGRYTHRIALSDGRLAHLDTDHVSFFYRDFRDNQKKRMTLKGTEFLRRFLQPVLPKGFMRVRHFGWLANASRAKTLPQIRAAIAAKKTEPTGQRQPQKQPLATRFEGIPCPCCKHSLMVVYALLQPKPTADAQVSWHRLGKTLGLLTIYAILKTRTRQKITYIGGK